MLYKARPGYGVKSLDAVLLALCASSEEAETAHAGVLLSVRLKPDARTGLQIAHSSRYPNTLGNMADWYYVLVSTHIDKMRLPNWLAMSWPEKGPIK